VIAVYITPQVLRTVGRGLALLGRYADLTCNMPSLNEGLFGTKVFAGYDEETCGMQQERTNCKFFCPAIFV
jgi:hypothetical protein